MNICTTTCPRGEEETRHSAENGNDGTKILGTEHRQIANLHAIDSAPPKQPKHSSWQVLERHKILDCAPWLKVHRETVSLPNGQIVDDYHQLELPDHVVIYPRTKYGMVATLQQYKHELRRETLTLPGGMIELGEDPNLAAARELREETGLESARWYPLGKFRVNGNLGGGDGYYFLADHCELSAPTDSGDLEEAQLQWCHPDNLLRMLNTGNISLIHHALAIALVRSFESDP